MPLARSSGARCVAHGALCSIGAGSSYSSARCARAPRPSKWDAPAEPTDQRDAELDGLLVEDRAAEAGVPLDEAADALAAEWAAGAKAWATVSPAQRCQALDGEDAELAELIAVARAVVREDLGQSVS